MEFVNQIIALLASLCAVTIVLTLHEFSHAFVAYKCGDPTPKFAGRLTLNPLRHFDLLGLALFAFAGFGWAKPVPINPLRMKKYRAGISLTALAGPVSNLLAAFVAGIAYNIIICTKSGLMALVSSEVTTMSCVLLLLSFLFQVNVGLAVFNLIPIPPLDGYNVLSYFTSEKVDRWFYRHQREVTFAFIVIILGLSYIPSAHNPLYIVTDFVSNALWKAVSWIPRVKWGW